MPEPTYSFTLPSLEDDTVLVCRIYHPQSFREVTASTSGRLPVVKGAVFAHPYAPLGGSYDDDVVLSTTKTLLEQGYLVATFNFRGAGESAGKTSWTGRAEINDYATQVGFVVQYLESLQQPLDDLSISSSSRSGLSRHGSEKSIDEASSRAFHLLLGGYSYGSLVLNRLPAVASIVKRFRDAETGTGAAEVITRARMLAHQTQRTMLEERQATQARGRMLQPSDAGSDESAHAKASPISMGGEETNANDRRRSRDSRRSGEMSRKSIDLPHRIKQHLRKDSERMHPKGVTAEKPNPAHSAGMALPEIEVKYLLVSPVVLPFSNTLCPPGPPTGFPLPQKRPGDSTPVGLFLQHQTLAIFGSNDSFTSAKRLRHWAEKQTNDSTHANFQWRMINTAGHFWREPGVMSEMQHEFASWLKSD